MIRLVFLLCLIPSICSAGAMMGLVGVDGCVNFSTTDGTLGWDDFEGVGSNLTYTDESGTPNYDNTPSARMTCGSGSNNLGLDAGEIARWYAGGDQTEWSHVVYFCITGETIAGNSDGCFLDLVQYTSDNENKVSFFLLDNGDGTYSLRVGHRHGGGSYQTDDCNAITLNTWHELILQTGQNSGFVVKLDGSTQTIATTTTDSAMVLRYVKFKSEDITIEFDNFKVRADESTPPTSCCGF